MSDLSKAGDAIKQAAVTSVNQAEAAAGAAVKTGVTASQGWLRRNVWGVVGVAAVALIIAGLVLLLHG